jgi:hypothetical protein
MSTAKEKPIHPVGDGNQFQAPRRIIVVKISEKPQN